MKTQNSRRVGLVSCAKKKAPEPKPAKELYMSPYFRAMGAYVESTCDEWWILSALHHLLHPDRVISPYNQTLKEMGRAGQKTWANRVLERLKNEYPSPDNIEFEIHGGAEYTRDLVPVLQSAGYHVEQPVPSLPIGKRLQWYKTAQSRELAMKGMTPRTSRPRPPTANDFCTELTRILNDAASKGHSHVDVMSGDLHLRVGYPGPDHRMPVCCSVMKQTIKPGDMVLKEPPSGAGARLLIRYHLPR